MLKDSKKLFSAAALSAAIALTACGGGGGGGGGGNNGGGDGGGNPPPQTNGYSNVEGPLDAVQEPLATQVFAPLAEGAAGTPVEGLLSCASQLVVTDVLDVLDSFLVIVAADPASLQDPQALVNGALPELQSAITELATDLPGVLASLADGDCVGDLSSGENPLAGTPLADLFETIEPVLGGFGGGDLSMASLSSLLSQLSEAYSEGLATVLAADPSGQIEGAPVLGGLLTTIDVALADLTTAIAALENMDTTATSAAVATTLDHLLNNVLTGIVPIALIEEQAGLGPVVSAPIADAVAAITGLIGGDLGAFDGLTSGDFASLFDGGLEDLLAGFGGAGDSPLAGTPLADIQGLIETALAGSLPGVPGDTGLGVILQPLTAVLDALLASSGGPTNSPLDLILGPLAEGLGGSAGAAGCPVAGTGLDVLCTITQGLLDNPDSNPLSVITGLLEDLLGILNL